MHERSSFCASTSISYVMPLDGLGHFLTREKISVPRRGTGTASIQFRLGSRGRVTGVGRLCHLSCRVPINYWGGGGVSTRVRRVTGSLCFSYGRFSVKLFCKGVKHYLFFFSCSHIARLETFRRLTKRLLSRIVRDIYLKVPINLSFK